MISVLEAAVQKDVPKYVIRMWAEVGKVKSKKQGGEFIIDKEDLSKINVDRDFYPYRTKIPVRCVDCIEMKNQDCSVFTNIYDPMIDDQGNCTARKVRG